MTSTPPPWEPPLAGTESEHLIAMLERLRATFRWKVDGLDRDQLAARPIPSTELTLGGLLKHLALVEDDKFGWVMLGERPETRFLAPDPDDIGLWQFTVRDDETAASLYALWDDAVARSRARTAGILERGALDAPAQMQFGDAHPSNRRFICDLIEEYGRHTGHADLIREAIDGRVGEDPPGAA